MAGESQARLVNNNIYIFFFIFTYGFDIIIPTITPCIIFFFFMESLNVHKLINRLLQKIN